MRKRERKRERERERENERESGKERITDADRHHRQAKRRTYLRTDRETETDGLK